MDFYASHALWLAHLKRIQAERKKVKRVIGVEVKAQCKKNKVAPPFRECVFPIIFGYGIEDLTAGLEFLISVGRTDAIGLTQGKAKSLKTSVGRLTDERYHEERANVNEAVREVWREIEESFSPKRRKYGSTA
jgi:hypothetical protein